MAVKATQVSVCPIPCHKYIPFREEKKERGQHNTVQNLVRSHTRFTVSGVFICGFAVLIHFFAVSRFLADIELRR